MLEIDDEGDLVDSGNIPEDTSAAEVGAFIEYALEQAHETLSEQLYRARFGATWPEGPVVNGEQVPRGYTRAAATYEQSTR